MPLQIRRGTNVERQAITPAPGELIFVTNTNQLFVGNGVTVGGILATGYTNNDAQDAAAVIFTANNSAHSNINFAYNTSTNLITAAVDLSDYQGVIRADAFKGSVFADDGSTVGGTELVNAVDGSINLDGTVKGHIVPDVNVAYDLGSTSLRFRDLYLSGSSIELGAATITSTGSAVNLPSGSTINGVLISDIESGVAPGSDYNINIVGDDSSSIINSSTRTVTASGGFFGNISGNVLGNVTGNVLGNVTGNVTGYHIGDMTGSVFADDSGRIIDSINKTITINELNVLSIKPADTFLSADGIEIKFDDDDAEKLVIYSKTLGDYGDAGIVQLRNFTGTVDNQTNTAPQDILGGLQITGLIDDEYKSATTMIASWDVSANPLVDFPASKCEIFIGNNTNDEFPWVFRFTHKGTFEAPVIKAASYTTALLPVSPEAGWLVFDSDIQKFKGYVSDTGLAGGGAPNATPGWVNLN